VSLIWRSLIPETGCAAAAASQSNALHKVCEARVGVKTLRSGVKKACERAGIPFGLTVEGGLIWHDLRRTFATELRARQVHEYDIADLLGWLRSSRQPCFALYS